MKVLIACEMSGRVREAFRAKGHDAISCDLLPSEQEGPHIVGDVRDILTDGWDLMIAHPPCTYLTSANARNHFRFMELQDEALDFVELLLNAPIERIALENPPGAIGSQIRKATQYVEPWEFGAPWTKKTGLWLKNLPPLKATHRRQDMPKRLPTMSDVRKDPKDRARTPLVLAAAMAEQWG